jgi:D-alanine-D-alanine ligase
MGTKDEERWNRIERAVGITKAAAHDTHLSMVLNEPLHSDIAVDYGHHSIATEYLDDTEKSELMTGLRDAGFATTVYDGERAFLTAVLNGNWKKDAYNHKYVFNTTGSGIGRARTSLIPSFCDLYRIPLCSADGLTAALLENKFYTFRLLAALGYPVPHTSLYVPSTGWNGSSPHLDSRVICKPCRECSSIGVDDSSVFNYESSKVDHIEEMARTYRQPILVQEFISGYEVEVPVFPAPEPTSSSAIGIKIGNRELLDGAFLAHKTIVEEGYDFYDFALVDAQVAAKLKSVTEAAYGALCLSGIARVDWRVMTNGSAYITDFNTPPHLTHHSSCRFAFEHAGYTHSDLMACVVTIGRLNGLAQKLDQI